jgi:hypothetical protein
MSGSVEVTIKDSGDETATQQTGSISESTLPNAGTGDT